jgi:hypothetical protein
MNTETLTTAPTTADVADLYRACIMRATIAEIAAAATWYNDAEDIARDIATIMGISLENGASVVSGFSPRQFWHVNVRLAYAFANGLPVKTLGNNITMAENAVTMGFDALNGPKTNAFARAIAGDENAIVIDTWMVKAAGMDSKKSLSKGAYNMLADAVSIVAAEFDIAPRIAQALIWIVYRGKAN